MDLWADDAVTVRRIQPYEARKTYLCPGCNQDIPPGTGHVVAVPNEAAKFANVARSGALFAL